jgi:hypothetical protein
MKRISMATGLVLAMAGSSLAGGVPEMLPETVEKQTSSSAGGIIVPLLLLLLVAALVSSGGNDTAT